MRREIDGPEPLRLYLGTEDRLAQAVFHGLDLRAIEPSLEARGLEGGLFVGCHLSASFVARAVAAGSLVFPRVDGRPFDPWRTRLYTPEELYAGFDPDRPGSHQDTPDHRIYASFVDPATRRARPTGLDDVLAHRLHDFSVSDALQEFLAAIPAAGVVAVMGGHDRRRNDPLYEDVARLARTLTRDGFLLVSGGGPGLMEATNLGAYLAERDDTDLGAALDLLAEAPEYHHPLWLAQAFRVRAQLPLRDAARSRSLGIPTWFYGHEPPNPFATQVAKYFENSVREEGLLAMATHGVIFAPGNAGTVQEIFQDACQNYYRTYTAYASPMILFGVAYWTGGDVPGSKPVWPLVQALAREKGFLDRVSCTDSTEAVLDQIRAFRP